MAARVDHRPLAVATAELATGAIDALLWSGGVPTPALGTQYLDQRSLIATGDVPLHPGAAQAYRDLRG